MRVLLALCVVTVVGCNSRDPERVVAAEQSGSGQTRNYFIAAEDVAWDYAPSGINKITGQPFEGDALFAAMPSEIGLGHVYKKTVFREYTDATFATRKPRAPEWEHLGILGPMVRAEVGDTIQIVFKNNARHPHTLHPHGVFYDKSSEGADYDDGSGKKYGVAP